MLLVLLLLGAAGLLTATLVQGTFSWVIGVVCLLALVAALVAWRVEKTRR
jgi:hypothetical protein